MAIVGRPNVGKSTLFNRLVGRRLALVDDQPGVTRDLREGDGRLADLRFTVIDTAGLENARDDSLPARMRRLTERAVDMADICLFVVDSRSGLAPDDFVFADILRKRSAHVLVAANKAEGRAGEAGALDAYRLGLGDPVLISAEHGEGMEDLYSALRPIADAFDAEYREAARRAALEAAEAAEAANSEAGAEAVQADPEAVDGVDADQDANRALRIAIVGRPNAGKSTLVNQILGEDRLLTGPEAGITRDSIGLEVDWAGRRFKIYDTAGMRKRAKVQDKVEKLSVDDALRAIRFAEVVVVLSDIDGPFETQDLKLVDLAHREGRALVLGVNKWDLEEDKQRKLGELKEKVDRLLPQARGAPLVMMSGLTGRNVDRLREGVLKAYEAWNVRVSTSKLNRWLAIQAERHPPPAPGGRRIRLRYMTQAKTRPPTFVLFTSRPDDIPESYLRFLVNGLRDAFNMDGASVRLLVRGTENPFANKAKKKK
ncbi:MAG: ribosome biogenesis GTPase Der [Neomegalonema sp.]|nr:ribosome biogenesis GTPase Der [Neomegalonema sp.]